MEDQAVVEPVVHQIEKVGGGLRRPVPVHLDIDVAERRLDAKRFSRLVLAMLAVAAIRLILAGFGI